MYCIYCTIYCSIFCTICLLFSLYRWWEVAHAKRKTFTISALAVRQRILRNLIQGFQYELLLAAVKFVKIFCCLRYIFNSPTYSISTSSMLSLSSWVILCLFVMVFFAEPKVSALGTSAFHIQNLWFVFPKPGVLSGCSGFRLWEFFHMRNELADVPASTIETRLRSFILHIRNGVVQGYFPHSKRMVSAFSAYGLHKRNGNDSRFRLRGCLHMRSLTSGVYSAKKNTCRFRQVHSVHFWDKKRIFGNSISEMKTFPMLFCYYAFFTAPARIVLLAA